MKKNQAIKLLSAALLAGALSAQATEMRDNGYSDAVVTLAERMQMPPRPPMPPRTPPPSPGPAPEPKPDPGPKPEPVD